VPQEIQVLRVQREPKVKLEP